MESRWNSRWETDGKPMEKHMESLLNILWKVDGKPTEKHMDKADEEAGGQTKSDGESYFPSGCMGTQLVLWVLAATTPQLYSKLIYCLKFNSEADHNKNTRDTRK